MLFVAFSLLWNRRLRRELRLIRKSRLFDAAWYFLRYPSARLWMGNPAFHYLHCGARKGCNPHPLFDTRWYLDEYPDVGAAGQNPLVHYLKSGAVEGHNPNPVFDTRWYLRNIRDAAEARRNPLIHYLTTGAIEGCDPNPLFESLWYLSRNPDLKALGCNPLAHYFDKGWQEGRNPGPHFDGNHYLKQNPDVAADKINPLVHFIRYGWQEGRRASPFRNFLWSLQDRQRKKSAGINRFCDSLLEQITAASIAASGDPKVKKKWIAPVATHLKERGSIAEPEVKFSHPGRPLLEPINSVSDPSISIIVPSAADSPLLLDCLRSILEKTTYLRYEIFVLVEKESIKNQVGSEILSAVQQMPGVRVVEYDFPFNYSRVNNLAAKHARGDVLVFLNDDTSVVTPKWLEVMVTHLFLPGVGAVGPRLLFPDGSIQHAGIVLGLRGAFAHVLRGFPGDAGGSFGSPSESREVSAVTGACLMTRAATYQSVGGMRECFVSTHQDVDLCLRIRRLGLSIVYAANAELIHHEIATRGFACNQLDREIFADRWHEVFSEDPYFNTNSFRSKGDYAQKGD